MSDIVKIICSDITKLTVDVIVNAANKKLCGGKKLLCCISVIKFINFSW